MSTYDWLLMIHVTGAFLLLGGATAAGILNARAWHAERASEVVLLLRLISRAALPAIGIGSALTVVIGLWLVHHQGYSYGAFWVWGALVLWMLASALGGRSGTYQSRTQAEAERLAAGDDTLTADLRALIRNPVGNALAYGSGLTFVLVLVLMIWKPGQ